MDRRRSRSFVPGVDSAGLEERRLLSTATTPKPTPAEKQQHQKEKQAAARAKQQQDAFDNAVKVRLQRIDRLPRFLQSLQPGRYLPPDTVASIQDQLRLLLGQLRTPVNAVSTQFVKQLRQTIADPSISNADAAAINFRFGQLLTSAQAPQGVIETLQSDMTELVKVDVGSRNPPFLVSNDYALVMQTALAVGKPLPKLPGQ